jgi:hypothetical protein
MNLNNYKLYIFILNIILPLLIKSFLILLNLGSPDSWNYHASMELFLKSGAIIIWNYWPSASVPQVFASYFSFLLGLPSLIVFKFINLIPDLLISLIFLNKLYKINSNCLSLSNLILCILLQLIPSIAVITIVDGQMDSWAILFSIISIELFIIDKYYYDIISGLSIILAVGLHIFPIFIIPLLLLNVRKFKRIYFIIFGILVGFILHFIFLPLDNINLNLSHVLSLEIDSNNNLIPCNGILYILKNSLGYNPSSLFGFSSPYENMHNYFPLISARLYKLIFIALGMSIVYYLSIKIKYSLYKSSAQCIIVLLLVSFSIGPNYITWPLMFLIFSGHEYYSFLLIIFSTPVLIYIFYSTINWSGAYVPICNLNKLIPYFAETHFSVYLINVINSLLKVTIIELLLIYILYNIINKSKYNILFRSSNIIHNIKIANKIIFICVFMVTIFYTTTVVINSKKIISGLNYNSVNYNKYIINNYFSYGNNYIYTFDLNQDFKGKLVLTFAGNDYYAFIDQNHRITGPFVGSLFNSHHWRLWTFYKPISVVVDDLRKIKLLDNNSSITKYENLIIGITDSKGLSINDKVVIKRTYIGTDEIYKIAGADRKSIALIIIEKCAFSFSILLNYLNINTLTIYIYYYLIWIILSLFTYYKYNMYYRLNNNIK